jgi:UDP-N-acetylglucosamine diphosphorylase / glucose-1-phosphate thymidylyltransferase / UDP-N-acetylgalactosamine diphosphorylase / glucosamine-1-phosphate N-acetyltransferase / galactosamine-1-phosphate N-acetyltransferase
MKAVIIAAGEGRRMRPLTLHIPKPLLKISGKAIIDYAYESLPAEIEEVIVVVKYLSDQIKAHIRKNWSKKKVEFARGSDRGTAFSFLAARKYLHNEKFLFLYGDEVPDPRDVKNCLKKNLSILVFKSTNPRANGIAYLRKNGTIKGIVEKPDDPSSNTAIDGVMVLNTDIFDYMPLKTRSEYYFSTMIDKFVLEHNVYPVKSISFIGDVTTPKDLRRVGKLISLRNE